MFLKWEVDEKERRGRQEGGGKLSLLSVIGRAATRPEVELLALAQHSAYSPSEAAAPYPRDKEEDSEGFRASGS